MKAEYKIILISILAGALLWVIEGLLDYVFQGTTFGGGLILNIPLYEILLRSAIVTCFVVYGLVLSRIFTKRKQMEKELVEKQSLLNLLMDAVPDHIFFKDRHSRIIRANKAHAQTWTGGKAEELIGKTDFDLFPREYAQKYYDEEQEVMRSGQPLINEVREVPHPSGGIMWRSITKIPLFDESGQVTGLVGISRDITERVHMEQALREERDRARQYLDVAGVMMVALDAEGRVTMINRKGCEILGYNEEEIIGKNWFDHFLPKRIRDRVKSVFRRLIAEENEPVEYYENPVLTAGGEERIVAWHNTVLRDAEGTIIGTLSSGEDITERKRAEEALRRSEERYRAVAEGAFAGIGIVDPDENITYANRAFAEMLGYTPDELIGMNLSQLTSPEEYAQYREFTRRRKEEGGREHYETTMYRKDGTAINLLVSASPLTTADGRFAGTMGVIVDITERVRMEKTQSVLLSISEAASTTDNLRELLRIIHKQLGTLLNATNFYVALYDEETGLYSFPYHVDQYDRVDNHTPQELGRGLTEYVRRTGAPLLADEELIEELVRKGEIERVGTPSHLWMGAPLRTPRGVIGVAAVQSYTDQDAYSSDDLDLLAFVSEHIASVIDHKRAEREREEAQSRFLQAQKMEAIGRLTGGIAHDFNNLLTAINGFAQLLQIDLPSSDPRQEYVARIREAGQRAAQLTRQLLAFSRKQIIAPRVVNLNEVVRDMDKMLRRIIGEDIEIDMVLSPDLWLVKVDPSQMQQVIMNLAVNARDAMPQGGKLAIETANVVLDDAYVARHVGTEVGEHVMLAISDTGVGMSEEVQAHIFEPFFTTKEEGKGTGLGLATVYGIVKQSGGNIWCYSEEGMGTTFKIYLPRTLEEEATVEKGEETTAIPKGQGVIFLVEDDDTVRELSVWILRRAGYTVLDTGNPEEAIERVRDYPGRVDLLITDVVMPGMSGRELAQRIAEIRPGVKVLYMSGYTDNAIVDHGVLEPGMAFLQKPFTPNTLAGKVREVLGG